MDAKSWRPLTAAAVHHLEGLSLLLLLGLHAQTNRIFISGLPLWRPGLSNWFCFWAKSASLKLWRGRGRGRERNPQKHASHYAAKQHNIISSACKNQTNRKCKRYLMQKSSLINIKPFFILPGMIRLLSSERIISQQTIVLEYLDFIRDYFIQWIFNSLKSCSFITIEGGFMLSIYRISLTGKLGRFCDCWPGPNFQFKG